MAFNLLPPHFFSNRIPIPFFNKLRSTNNTHALVQLTILHSYSDPNALSIHKHHSPQMRYRKNQITSISFLLLFNSNTMSIHFKHTSSQPFSIPTNSSRQYHNRQNYHSIRLIFDSIQFDSIRFNSIQFDSIRFNSIQFDSIRFNSIQFYPQTSQQFPHSAVLIVAALRTIQTIQTIEVAAVRVPSSSLFIVAPLNTKFPSFGSNVSHSVSNPTLRGRISSVVRHSCPSVNQ